jgi:hypothetical protein
VGKDATSRYVGGRTLKWLKVKQPKYREVERDFYKTWNGASTRRREPSGGIEILVNTPAALV